MSDCEFPDPDMEIKAQIEHGTRSKQLRRYAFRHTKQTLTELLDYGRILETAENDARGIEKTDTHDNTNEVNALRKNPNWKSAGNKMCFQCGYK